jgi:uncharacterized protein YecE (DUF72 family)
MRIYPKSKSFRQESTSMSRRSKKKSDLVRIGTSSFSETSWIGPFYPLGTKPADFLTYYATRFDTVEVDATYYAIPSAQTVEGWRRKTPEGFLISAKFPRSIVHGGKGAKPDPGIILIPDVTYSARDKFLEVISGLGRRLGPLVLQFPYFSKAVFESADMFMERLERFLTHLPRDFRYAVEIRNRNWLSADFADLLRKLDVGLVLVDQAWMPHGDQVEQMFDPVTADFSYIRLLGDRKEIEAITNNWDKEVINRGERLDRWAELIAQMVERDVETLVYVNNHYAGHAPTTAERLNDMLLERISG